MDAPLEGGGGRTFWKGMIFFFKSSQSARFFFFFGLPPPHLPNFTFPMVHPLRGRLIYHPHHLVSCVKRISGIKMNHFRLTDRLLVTTILQLAIEFSFLRQCCQGLLDRARRNGCIHRFAILYPLRPLRVPRRTVRIIIMMMMKIMII